MFEKITNFVTHVGTIYAVIIAIISIIVAGYNSYDNFLRAIKENQKQIQITQIMILKPLVRQSENNPCYISDIEWDEYLMNGSTLQELKHRHKLISKNLAFTPIKRVRKHEEPTKCKD